MILSHSLPCNHPSPRYSTDLLYALQDTSDHPIRKHMYSHISENNFVPSKQIIVPTGYKYNKYNKIGQYKLFSVIKRNKDKE